MEALFTSLASGVLLRARILDTIAEAAALSDAKRTDLHVMAFAFTDGILADALADAAARRPSLTVRILGDWRTRTQQVGRLAKLGVPNLIVRYSRDQPYVWDNGRLRWSYHASRGLLHHKTLAVLVDGRPWRLICGSFNWTATATRSYENLIVVSAEDEADAELMARTELEFEALWSDGRASLAPDEAQAHYDAILEEFRADPTLTPAAIVGLAEGQVEPLAALDRASMPPSREGGAVAIAFSSRGPDAVARRGAAAANCAQRFVLRTAFGALKSMPLTLTYLALDTIFRAAPGDTLKIAMYGLSPRVPEYGALIDAARRGVRLLVLLDRGVGSSAVERLAEARASEALPIEVRAAGRMMHNKYIVHVESATVLTGTANLSTDATARHSEHRLRVHGRRDFAERFEADFDAVWSRLKWDPPLAAQEAP